MNSTERALMMSRTNDNTITPPRDWTGGTIKNERLQVPWVRYQDGP